MLQSICLSALFALTFLPSNCWCEILMPYAQGTTDVFVPDPGPDCPDRCLPVFKSRSIPLVQPLVFFDEMVDDVRMWVDGYLDVGNENAPRTGWPNPRPIPAPNVTGLVAVHWKAVSFDFGGQLLHRVTDSSQEDFGAIADFIQTCEGGEGFEPIHAIVATWDRVVESCGELCFLSATFQLVMAYAGDKTWALMGYDSLEYPLESRFRFTPARRGFNSVDGEFGYVIGDALGEEQLGDVLMGTNCGAAYTGLYGYDVSTRDANGGGGDETGTLIMVNARGDVDVDIGPIEDGQQYDRSELGRSYSVRAEGFAGEVGSVVFSLDGVEYNIENSSPYYMNTKRRENARRVPEFAELGTYTVTATAWSEDDGSGTVVETLSATFEIVR